MDPGGPSQSARELTRIGANERKSAATRIEKRGEDMMGGLGKCLGACPEDLDLHPIRGNSRALARTAAPKFPWPRLEVRPARRYMPASE